LLTLTGRFITISVDRHYIARIYRKFNSRILLIPTIIPTTNNPAKHAASIQKLIESLQSTNEEYKKLISEADSNWEKQVFTAYTENLESAYLIAELPNQVQGYLENIETEQRKNYEYCLEYYSRLAREAIASENQFTMTEFITGGQDGKNKIEELFPGIQQENGS